MGRFQPPYRKFDITFFPKFCDFRSFQNITLHNRTQISFLFAKPCLGSFFVFYYCLGKCVVSTFFLNLPIDLSEKICEKIDKVWLLPVWEILCLWLWEVLFYFSRICILCNREGSLFDVCSFITQCNFIFLSV